jgi:pilus assembly protein CpaF
MLSLLITEKGGEPYRKEFEGPEITIGRVQGNDIVLAKSNISKRHARIVNQDGELLVIDTKSTNGTYVNGNRIDAPYDLRHGDKVFIGDFTIELAEPPAQDHHTEVKGDGEVLNEAEWGHAGALDEDWSDDWGNDGKVDVGDRRKAPSAEAASVQSQAKGTSTQKMEPARAGRPSGSQSRRPSAAIDLGPLSTVWSDLEVEQISIAGPGQMFVRTREGTQGVNSVFRTADELERFITGLLQTQGLALTEASPLVAMRLADGTRVTATGTPYAVHGPYLTLHRAPPEPLEIDDWVAHGGLTAGMAEFLENTVRHRTNVLVSGPAGAGKTAFINMLAGYIPDREAVISVEHQPELRLDRPHWISLASAVHPDTARTDMAMLLRQAIAMSPDRLIIGDCDSNMAWDILQYIAGGGRGTMITLPAHSAADAMQRLVDLSRVSASTAAPEVIRADVGRAIDVVVHLATFADGTRRVSTIAASRGDGRIELQNVFVFQRLSTNAKGQVSGAFHATGEVPEFYKALRDQGANIDLGIFADE